MSRVAAGIAAKLQEMAEYKSQVSFFERLTVEEGVTEPPYGYNSTVPFQPVEIKSYIDEANRQSQIQLFKKKIEDLQDDDKYFVEFDGVYMNSDVWINGHHLGNRALACAGQRCLLVPDT